MTWISDDDYPLEFKVRVSTDDLTALRFINRLSKNVTKGEDKHIKKVFKTLRDLERKIEARLLLGADTQ